MPLPLMAIGAGISGLSAIGKMIFGAKQNKMANKINPSWSQYVTSPFAKQQLATAQNAFGGRMAGAQSLENNIYGNQASTQSNINRNATSSAQALALAGGVQGQTNDAFQNLQIKEGQNQTNMLGNLNNAYGQLIQEGDKEYQSKMQKFMLDTQQQAALRESGVQNIAGGVNDIAGLFGTLGMGQQQNNFWQQLLAKKPQGQKVGGGIGAGIFG